MNNVIVIEFMLFALDSSFFINAIVSSRNISKLTNLSRVENRVLSSEIDRIVV